MKRLAFAFSTLALTATLFAAVSPAAMADTNGYRDARGVWHNADGSVPGASRAYGDRQGAWQERDHRAGGVWRISFGGHYDVHGVWHNADGSVPGGQGYRDRRGVWHNPDGSVPGRIARDRWADHDDRR